MNKTSPIIENSIIVGLSSYFDLSVVQSLTCLNNNFVIIICHYAMQHTIKKREKITKEKDLTLLHNIYFVHY